MATDAAKKNMELQQTLDDAWNKQDWETFEQRHKPDAVIRWPAQMPTHGVRAHREECVRIFNTFPDNHIDNRPYKTFFASGDWTCSIANFTGTMKGALVRPDGTHIEPTGKRFQLDLCVVARWHDGQIVEENIFYDLVGMMQQLGIKG